MSPQVQTAEQTELDLGQPIKFETVQAAADWLKERAPGMGVDQAVIEDIEAVGQCDEQSKTRILRYCDAIGWDSSRFTW